MKKLLFLVIFCLSAYGVAFAQSKFPELDKIKQIKFLESTREDVERIFADYPFSGDVFVPSENALIHINYSIGNCDNTYEDWHIAKGKVKEIDILFRTPVRPETLRVDLSKFVKEKRYANLSKAFVYHKKEEGIAYDVYNDKIHRIIFVPSKENYLSLCDNERVKQYYSSKSWFSEKLKERRYRKGYIRPFANVTDLTLSLSEIMISCATDNLSQNKSCSDEPVVAVETKGSSPDPTDVITYQYEVSGGRIVGFGANVIWDLSGVTPGTYKIIAGADNGCGVCGTTRTETVIVKECPDCSQKPE